MNRLEDRLRDAFGAAAETVRPESVVGLAGQTRPVRARRLAPLAAAAAVALVVIGVSVAVPLALTGGHGAPSRPGGPALTSPVAQASASSSSAGLIVPDVVGMQAAEAATILYHAGLQVAVVARGRSGQVHCSFSGPGQPCDSTVAAGAVIAEAPAAGASVPAGASITLLVAVTGSSPTPASAATG